MGRRVNRKWYAAARRIKQKRKRILYTNFSSSNMGCADEQIKDYLNVVSSEPETVIAFVSTSLDKSYIPASTSTSRLPRSAKQEKLSFHNYIKRQWPKVCSYIEVISEGVIASDVNAETIQEYENSEAASILMIPKRPDLDIEIKLPSLRKKMFEDYSGNLINDDDDDNTVDSYNFDDDYGKYDFENETSETDRTPYNASASDAVHEYDESFGQNSYEDCDNSRIPNSENPRVKLPNNSTKNTLNDVKNVNSNKISDDGKLMEPKLVLYFYDEIRPQMPRMLCKHYKSIVAGCHVDRISLGDKYTTSIAVIFRGRPNVQCASMVLTIFCKKIKTIELELKKFMPFLKEKFEGKQKNEGKSSSFSSSHPPTTDFNVSKYSDKIIGFMFSCVARGAKFYRGNPNVESNVFKKLFPRVPLFGLFGYGEVGINVFNEDDLKQKVNQECHKKTANNEEEDDEDNEFFNTNSTVFVLLAL